MGRGPGERHIIVLPFDEEGVDTSNGPLVSHWYSRPGSKQFDGVVAIRNNVASEANHGGRGGPSGIDPVEGVIRSPQFSRIAGRCKVPHPSWDSSRLSLQASKVL